MTKLPIKPCGSQILVKLEEVQELSEGGIVIHTNESLDREEKGQNKGRVVALGPFVHADWEGFDSDKPADKAKAWGYDVGDIVLFSRYDGTEYELPGCENLVLMNASCIKGMYQE